MRRHFSRIALCLLAAGWPGCGSDSATSSTPAPASTATPPPSGPGPAPLFVLPASLDAFGQGCSIDGYKGEFGDCASSFLDHPFPSDFRVEGGKVRWAGFMNPRKMPPVDNYTKTVDRLLDGFSPQATGFVRFSGSIDPSSLPADPTQALDAGAAAQLIDVDDASPERGKRRLITLFYRDQAGSYWPPSTLAFAPMFGAPLRTKTRYAFVVTRKLKGAGGAELGRSAELDAVLGYAQPASEQATRLKESWAPSIKALADAGVAREQIAHLTVFTTNDPVGELFAARDALRQSFPAPAARDWVAKEQTADYDVHEGVYGPSPNFQKGVVPYIKPADGGDFEVENGVPKVQNEFDLRFALVTPKPDKCPMPPEGYPVVLYAHGTGGDYRSFIDDKTGSALAARCVASMGIDQIFHGTRPGAPDPGDPNAENLIAFRYFNIDNPAAARTNGRQSALDEVQRARLFTETKITIPAALSATGSEIRFDPTRVMFFGHSQGGQNGPLYLAVDDSARGGVLSGSGSVFAITLLEKTKPTPSVATAVKTIFLGLKGEEQQELNYWHPAFSLAQSLVDTVDPIHYVGHILLNPREGFAPKSVYQTEGISAEGVGDSYTPPRSIEVQAVATGLPLMNPSLWAIPEMGFAGLAPVDVPPEGLSGNLAGGKATGVLAQWAPPGKSDGHFVVFNVSKARAQAAQFCRNLADNPAGLLPAP